MFSTFNENELHLTPDWHEEGERFWSSITHESNKVFFQVLYQKSNNAELEKVVFVLSAEQLVGLMHIKEIDISEVNLISPGCLNKTGKWLLEPLSQIYVGSEPGEDWQDVFIYQMDDGQKYIDSALDTEEKNVTQIHCIFDKKTTC